jgi:serralysin
MVTKNLTGSTGGDLGNAADKFGTEADHLYVKDSGDYTIITFGANDIVDASARAAYGFHTVVLGAGDDYFIGNLAPDHVFDGSGNDKYLLGRGDDMIHVGNGNDYANGGEGNDTVDFRYVSFDGNPGFDNSVPPDLNAVGVTLDLAKKVAQNLGAFGMDRLINFENAFGGDGADHFFGTSGANIMLGLDGNDVLAGRGGNDQLISGDGRDMIIGGRGADGIALTEVSAARDVVKYQTIADSGVTNATMDTIYYFDANGTTTSDKIDLSMIDANASITGNQSFIFQGTGAFISAAGEIRLEVVGGDTLVHVDMDGTSQDEMSFWVAGVTGLRATDFIL